MMSSPPSASSPSSLPHRHPPVSLASTPPDRPITLRAAAHADDAAAPVPAPQEETSAPRTQTAPVPAPPAPRHAWHLVTREPQPAPAGMPYITARLPDLLLVHGAGHAAWCWEKLQVRCAHWGIRTHAISLRGHGGRPGVDPSAVAVAGARLDDYVADVAQAAAQISAPFVIAGHSLGGIVVQRYLSWLAAGRTLARPAGAILLATATPADLLRGWRPSLLLEIYGIRGLVAMLARTLVGTRPIEMCPTPAHTQRLFFTPTTPEADVLACYLRLEGEPPALWRDVRRFARGWHAAGARALPTLVLGGAQDACVAPEHAKRLAQHYGASMHLFAGMGHDLMLDVGWAAVADTMADWLRELPPTPLEPLGPTARGACSGGRATANTAVPSSRAAAPAGQLVPLRPLWDGASPSLVPLPRNAPTAVTAVAGSWNAGRDQLPSQPPRRDQDPTRHHRPARRRRWSPSRWPPKGAVTKGATGDGLSSRDAARGVRIPASCVNHSRRANRVHATRSAGALARRGRVASLAGRLYARTIPPGERSPRRRSRVPLPPLVAESAVPDAADGPGDLADRIWRERTGANAARAGADAGTGDGGTGG